MSQGRRVGTAGRRFAVDVMLWLRARPGIQGAASAAAKTSALWRPRRLLHGNVLEAFLLPGRVIFFFLALYYVATSALLDHLDRWQHHPSPGFFFLADLMVFVFFFAACGVRLEMLPEHSFCNQRCLALVYVQARSEQFSNVVQQTFWTGVCPSADSGYGPKLRFDGK